MFNLNPHEYDTIKIFKDVYIQIVRNNILMDTSLIFKCIIEGYAENEFMYRYNLITSTPDINHKQIANNVYKHYRRKYKICIKYLKPNYV